jgi:hypothetical protein
MESVHPSCEEAAAYIEGRQAPAVRRRVAEHLASCDDCFELYTEALYCLSDASAKRPKGIVVPFSRRDRALKRWLPAAAAAVLVLAVGFGGYRSFVARPEIEVADLVRTLRVSDGLVENVWVGETLRGANDGADVDLTALSFLVGAHLVGFQASLEAGDSEAAAAAAARVSSVLTQGNFVDTAVKRFREARQSLRQGRARGRFMSLVEETSPIIEKALYPVYLDFGEWAQAGRIAALSRSEAFFAERANRRFLTWLLEQDEEAIDDDAMVKLRAIERIWRSQPIAAESFGELADAFTAILDLYETRGRIEPSFS